MKRRFIIPALLTLLAASAPAQDSSTPVTGATGAAGVAAKEAADERYERMAADIQALQAANQALESKVSNLEQQLADLRNTQSQAQNAGNTSAEDDIKRLAAKVEEVDRKREEDKQAISDEIHRSIGEVEKLIGEQPRNIPTPLRERPETSDAAPAPVGKGFVYTVQEGDFLSAIVKAYNKDFRSKGMKPITLSQAMAANPKVDWNRLSVGQKIVIPQPEQQ